MVIPEGYKQTEVGVVPEEWKICTVSFVSPAFEIGGNYKNNITPTPYPLIKMGNIGRGSILVTEKIEYIQDEVPSEKHRLYYNDVLLNTRNTPELVGKVGIWKNELYRAYFNSNLLRFVFDSSCAVPEFYNYYFNTRQVIKALSEIAKGTTSVAAIYPNDLAQIHVLVPSKVEQRKIANVLSDIDELIHATEKLLSKKQAIKQGVMQELLTGKRRLPGFSGEWKEYTLAELGDFSKGSGISRAEADSGRICAVRYGELYTRHINYVKRYYSHISEEAANKAQRVYFGDILFAASGETKEEIGKCASIIDDNEVFAGGDIVVFHPRSPIHPIFLGCLLNTPKVQKQKSEKAQGDAIVHIHADSLQKIVISIPTYEEQSAIGEILKNMDDEIDELELKLSKYRRMKQGMMQQLLTGKIRLV